MAYINEFPHIRNYDQDLGQLIHLYKKLINSNEALTDKYEELMKVYELVKQNITNITIEQLQKWVDDGTLAGLINDILLKKKPNQYTTALEMIDDETLTQGQICFTSGYSNVNDLGAGKYIIVQENIPLSISCKNGKYALLCYNGTVNVAALGYDTTGNQDISTKLNSLLNYLPENETIYFPRGTYAIVNQININKATCLKGVMGASIHVTDTMNGSLFNCVNGIVISANNVEISGLNFRGVGANTAITINPSTQPANVSMNIRLKDLIIRDFIKSGIDFNRTIIARIVNVNVGNCGIGFNCVGTTQTSLHFDRCWALNCTQKGYQIYQCNYVELSNCACDDCPIAYFIQNCYGVVLNACGAENITNCATQVNSCLSVLLNGCLFTNCNTSASSSANCVLVLGSNVTLISAIEFTAGSTKNSVNWDAASLVYIMGSTFKNNVPSSDVKGELQNIFCPKPTGSPGLHGYVQQIITAKGCTISGDPGNQYMFVVVMSNPDSGAYVGVRSGVANGGYTIPDAATYACQGFQMRVL